MNHDKGVKAYLIRIVCRADTSTRHNKKLSYRKETVRLLHSILLKSGSYTKAIILMIGLCRSNRERRL